MGVIVRKRDGAWWFMRSWGSRVAVPVPHPGLGGYRSGTRDRRRGTDGAGSSCEKGILRDPIGKIRATLAATADGTPALRLYDRDGEDRATVAMTDGGGAFSITNRDGKIIATAEARADVMVIQDRDFATRAEAVGLKCEIWSPHDFARFVQAESAGGNERNGAK